MVFLTSDVVPFTQARANLSELADQVPPQSAEALAQLATFPVGAAGALREYLHDDYQMLYASMEASAMVYLLSIRHHRQLSFDFARLWPGST